MDKLGFTWYPKDWWTSDTFFELDAEERYIYLECIFLMYQNHGYLNLPKETIEARLRTQIKPKVWEKITQLLTYTDLGYTHKSVKKRSKKADTSRENGKLGGRPPLENKPNNPAINPPLEKKEKGIEKKRIETKENLFKPEFEKFISACFKYLGIHYTRGNMSTHGIETPIRKWLLTHDANIQLMNLNAYIKVIKEKQYRVKTIEKLLEKLEGYNFCQDLSTYVPAGNGLPKKTEKELADDEKERLKIVEGYKRLKGEVRKTN